MYDIFISNIQILQFQQTYEHLDKNLVDKTAEFLEQFPFWRIIHWTVTSALGFRAL